MRGDVGNLGGGGKEPKGRPKKICEEILDNPFDIREKSWVVV